MGLQGRFESGTPEWSESERRNVSVAEDTLETMNETERIEFRDNVQDALNDWYQAELASVAARVAWQHAYCEGYTACEEDSRFRVSDPKGEAGRNAAVSLLAPMQETLALATAHACWVAKLTGVPFVVLERPRK